MFFCGANLQHMPRACAYGISCHTIGGSTTSVRDVLADVEEPAKLLDTDTLAVALIDISTALVDTVT